MLLSWTLYHYSLEKYRQQAQWVSQSRDKETLNANRIRENPVKKIGTKQQFLILKQERHGGGERAGDSFEKGRKRI